MTIRTRKPDPDLMDKDDLRELREQQARYLMDWLCDMADGSFSRGSSFVEFEEKVRLGIMCLGFSSVVVHITPSLSAPGLMKKARLEVSVQEDYGEPHNTLIDYFDLS
jgi:hypothetical protein